MQCTCLQNTYLALSTNYVNITFLVRHNPKVLPYGGLAIGLLRGANGKGVTQDDRLHAVISAFTLYISEAHRPS